MKVSDQEQPRSKRQKTVLLICLVLGKLIYNNSQYMYLLCGNFDTMDVTSTKTSRNAVHAVFG